MADETLSQDLERAVLYVVKSIPIIAIFVLLPFESANPLDGWSYFTLGRVFLIVVKSVFVAFDLFELLSDVVNGTLYVGLAKKIVYAVFKFVVLILLFFKMSWFPVSIQTLGSLQIDVSNNRGDLLPAEQKHVGQFLSLASFRSMTFSLDRALEDYHRRPITYALGLAEINVELCEVVRQKDALGYNFLLNNEIYQRKRRDLGLEDAIGTLRRFTLFQFFQDLWGMLSLLSLKPYLFAITHNIMFSPIISAPSGGKFLVPVVWISELTRFRKNVNLLCHHAGSDVDELDMPLQTINNLRKFASDRNQDLAPLLEVNAKLNKELASYKRINAALQIRRTIEKLVSELPETTQFEIDGSGPKWQKLWAVIWADAGTNASNPFYKLWTDAKGQYACSQ